MPGSCRRARLLPLAVAVPLVVAACTADAPAQRTTTPAATAVAERTSGPLERGLDIVAGSALLGTVFHSLDGGWTAVLRIDGDPTKVVEAYRAQLQTALHAPVRPAPAQCGADLTQPPFEQLCRSGGGTGAYYTRLRALLSEDDDRDYVVLEWADLTTLRRTPSAPPPLPDGPTATTTDQEIAASYISDEQSLLHVVDGSRLLGDPLPNESVGYLAVLQITGDPADVMRGYADQFSDGLVRLWADGGVIGATLDQAGGAHITIRAEGSPPFALIGYDYD